MGRMRVSWPSFLLVLVPSLGMAQEFPEEAAWVPLPCRGGPMTDGFADEAGATAERDIVGEAATPAGWHAADSEFLYLRLRLDKDPAPGGSLRPFSWGIEIDLDSELTTYEVLLLVAKSADAVLLYRNTVTTLPDDPNDPADEPAVAMRDSATHTRSVPAMGSMFGGDGDFFLEIAFPFAELANVAIEPTTPLIAWAASSSTATSLNGDFACHDGASGEPTLSGTAPDPTVLDPNADTDHDGWTDATEVAAGTDPNDPASHPATDADARLFEGGGGCTIAPHSAGPGTAWLLLLLVSLLRSRRFLSKPM
jgi:hypothetical protein